MPAFTVEDAIVHEMHGSTFTSYVAPSRGSTELCAWRLDVRPGSEGVEHHVTREEVLYVLTGCLHATIDGVTRDLTVGDVALVPGGGSLRIDGGEHGASAWVVTTPGIEAVTADGTRIAPPWAR